MEFMEVYHEAMATWIIERVTSGKCEGAEFVFGLIESAIRKEVAGPMGRQRFAIEDLIRVKRSAE